MQRKRNTLRSSGPAGAKPARLELSPERAFVLHLDVRAHLPRRMVGRIEHVTSGQVAYVTCLQAVVDFMAAVLRSHGRSDTGLAHAVPAPCRSELAPSTRGPMEDDAAGSAAQPTRRGRRRGAAS